MLKNGLMIIKKFFVNGIHKQYIFEVVVYDNADKLSYDADTEGITGFMYGCAVSILSQCWEYGQYLRKWHNKEYGYDGMGVVNPAVMSLKLK